MLLGINELKIGKKKAQTNNSTDEETSELPRCLIHGSIDTKSVRMCTVLNDMLIAFSKERNINQKEIVEIAMVDFFTKYGDVEFME